MLCYEKGLAVHDLVEEFYQRLMICYRDAGRLSEALGTYRRCAQMLSIVLGLKPSAETRSIHESLMSRRLVAG